MVPAGGKQVERRSAEPLEHPKKDGEGQSPFRQGRAKRPGQAVGQNVEATRKKPGGKNYVLCGAPEEKLFHSEEQRKGVSASLPTEVGDHRRVV